MFSIFDKFHLKLLHVLHDFDDKVFRSLKEKEKILKNKKRNSFTNCLSNTIII